MRLLLLLTSVLIVGCNARVGEDAARDRLLEADRAFASASLEIGAAEAFYRYLADDALQLPAGANPLEGRTAIYEQMKAAGGAYTLAWDPQYAEVAASGELGWTWGTYVLTSGADAGGKVEGRGKYLNVWRLQPDGSWRVAVDMGNASPDPE
jgi:ketosteroid isomerase-like protein